MKGALRGLLRFAGKGESKVAAVFGFNPESSHQAVVHVRRGAPDVPVWLFTTRQPLPETVQECERVRVLPGGLSLLVAAQRQLWPRWVAIAVATWTGESGKWPVKLAPFLVPPFRALVLNEHGDFFAGTPKGLYQHIARRVRDAWTSGANYARDLRHAYWMLVSYHIWRSAPVRRVRDEAAGLALLAASLVLRFFAALNRPAWRVALFQRMHGNEALNAGAATGTGTEVARFRQARSHWDGETLEKFARASTARWILWQQNVRTEPWNDPPLDVGQRHPVFAISRQSHYRAWKSLLFPTAPFRQLQPGEVSHVTAPLSDTVLVDRLKLLELGVPRCSLAETAWMLLFWKAAAAGWRSYSVGDSKKLDEQPDYPIQETEFLLRIMTSRRLRQLGPREPDLGRGSIAFAPRVDGIGPDAGRPRVLVVSPFLPYPLSHGGAVRMFNLCRSLCGRVDFVLAAIREQHDLVDYPKLREVFQQVWVVDKDERPSSDESLPEQVRHHEFRALRALIREIAAQWQPHILQVEYTHLAAMREAAPDVPALLVEHDLTFSLYRQLAEKKDATEAARKEYHRWLEFERKWLARYDSVWTMSDEDRAVAIEQSGRPPDRTFTIPNGVDIHRFVPREEPGSDPEIFYVGSFRHLPNIIGFEKLREEVMPRVWQRFPRARLRVVGGPEHQMFLKRFKGSAASAAPDDRIVIHGFVEDLRPLYARATVVVVPLEVSAGTNIKVLEAMACGKAIVTTPIGCAGLGLRDREDALLEGDFARFAERVCELLADKLLRSRLSLNARRTVEAGFGWGAVADRAFESYLKTVETLRSVRSY